MAKLTKPVIKRFERFLNDHYPGAIRISFLEFFFDYLSVNEGVGFPAHFPEFVAAFSDFLIILDLVENPDAEVD